MKKKTLQKISRLFASLVLVGAMSLGTVATANAQVQSDKSSKWEATDTPEAAISVEYKMGNGVTTPKNVVKFNFTSASKPAGATYQPALSVSDITFDAGSDEIKDKTKTDIKVLRKQSSNFLANFKTSLTNPGMTVGEYTYTVTSASTVTKAKNADVFTGSNASYKITVFVAQHTDKTLYIKGLAVKPTKNDAGAEITNGAKVDATPGSTFDGSEGNFSGLKFVNEYVAKAGSVDPTDPTVPDPNDPKSYAFKVTNNATGTTASETGKFIYKMTLNRPSDVAATETTYKYYVNGTEKTGTYGVEETFELEAGKHMMVKSCYAGSTVSVTEKGVANWTATATPTFNGVQGSDVPGKMGTDVTVPGTIGQNENKVIFANVFKDIAVTGIIVNNFPFVMMIVMAMAAFVAIVAVKSRRRMNER